MRVRLRKRGCRDRGGGGGATSQDEPFPEPVRVRMGLHTGEATVVGGRFVGVAVHRATRICAAAAGGQVLVSRTTHEIVADALPTGLALDELGRRRLKGLEGLERLFALRCEPPAPQTDLRKACSRADQWLVRPSG